MSRSLRRRVPILIAGAVILVSAVVWVAATPPWSDGDKLAVIRSTDPAVAAAEADRRADGATVRDVTLNAAPTTITIDGEQLETWAFNGSVPGPEVRIQAGDVVRAEVRNDLPEPLTVHWHGIVLRNDMDGVPGLTQDAIQPGDAFTYEFTAPDPGTYFFHPHTGTDLDRGLYAPLIVEDPTQPPDQEVVVMIDDWIDGTGQTPDQVLEGLVGMSGMSDVPGTSGGGMTHDMGGMTGASTMPPMEHGSMGAAASADQPLGADTGDVDYPSYLINGLPATDPAEYDITPGTPVRLRLINAGSDTPFRVAVDGAPLTVVATDGYAVEPVQVDTLLIGMGERYDVDVTIDTIGAVALVATAEGKTGQALAVLRTGPGAVPAADAAPAELQGQLLSLGDLHAAEDARLPAGPVDLDYNVDLTGSMAPYAWGITGSSDGDVTLPVRAGDRVRLTIDNPTAMWHPVHLHGHTFQVVTDEGKGPRKDTLIVPAMSQVTIEFIADNPGQWALHCHNIYHAEVGMVTVLSYVR